MSIADLEQRVSAIEATLGLGKALAAARPETSTEDALWVVNGLANEGVDGVVMGGRVNLPGTGEAIWQYGLTSESLTHTDWTALAPVLDALSHPARLTILLQVLTGVTTTAALAASEELGTTGQLHHHLRQLVAAGWLIGVRRGEYTVPPQRVIPLLVTIMAAQR